MHSARRSPRYELGDPINSTLALPGVLLFFVGEALAQVWSTGNLRDELATQRPLYRDYTGCVATHFAYDVIFDSQWRKARAAELAQLLGAP